MYVLRQECVPLLFCGRHWKPVQYFKGTFQYGALWNIVTYQIVLYCIIMLVHLISYYLLCSFSRFSPASSGWCHLSSRGLKIGLKPSKMYLSQNCDKMYVTVTVVCFLDKVFFFSHFSCLILWILYISHPWGGCIHRTKFQQPRYDKTTLRLALISFIFSLF